MAEIAMLGLSAGASDYSADPLAPKHTTQKQLESAAQQFEGLLMHQMLKSASSAEGGWMGTGQEDTAGIQAMDLAQQQFAAAIAAQGGLGLAKIVIPQLTTGATLNPIGNPK